MNNATDENNRIRALYCRVLGNGANNKFIFCKVKNIK